MTTTQRNSATTGWPKGTNPSTVAVKNLSSNLLTVTVNRTINL